MRERVRNIWDIVRSGLWFIPSLLAVGSAVLATATVAYDESRSQLPDLLGWVYGGEPAGARSVLGAIAGSVATVAGVVFSISIVVTTLVSQQFGPRVVREFLRDVTNQVVLGVLVGTFVYALLVLRKVREGGQPFVPHLSVTVAMFLAVTSLIVLVIFLHHEAALTRAATIIPRLSRHLHASIDEQFSGSFPRVEVNEAQLPRMPCSQVVEADRSGYIQTTNVAGLLSLACDRDCFIKVLTRPGKFVMQCEGLAEVYSESPLDSKDVKVVRRSFGVGEERTQAGDLEFAVEQIQQIALRALSPAINDPFTAHICIDYLASALLHFSEKDRCGTALEKGGRLRLILAQPTFNSFLFTLFDPLRPHAAKHVPVTVRVLQRLRHIRINASSQEQRAALMNYADLLVQNVDTASLPLIDREMLGENHVALTSALNDITTRERPREVS